MTMISGCASCNQRAPEACVRLKQCAPGIAFDKCKQLTRKMPISYATRAAGVYLK